MLDQSIPVFDLKASEVNQPDLAQGRSVFTQPGEPEGLKFGPAPHGFKDFDPDNIHRTLGRWAKVVFKPARHSNSAIDGMVYLYGFICLRPGCRVRVLKLEFGLKVKPRNTQSELSQRINPQRRTTETC